MQSEELQIQFRQSQAAFAREVFRGHDALVPDDLLRRIKRHLVQLLQLGSPALVARNLQLHFIRVNGNLHCERFPIVPLGHLPAVLEETRCRIGTNSPLSPAPPMEPG